MKEFLKDLSFIELFIINTVCYFDLFDYPLTLTEVHNFLYTGGMEGGQYSLQEIIDNLHNNTKLQKIIATSSGFYYLKNRQAIVSQRLERYKLADQKFKIARRAFKIFRYLPFVRLIAVCNNLSYSNVTASSDIDLFIVTAPKRIWLTRFILVATIYLLGLRPPKTKVPDKICLSYYITSDNLDLSQTKINDTDIHLIFWLSTFWKIYERQDFWVKFYQANSWLKKYLPNWQIPEYSYRRLIVDNWLSQQTAKFMEFIFRTKLGDYLDTASKKIELEKMAAKKKDIAVSKKNWVIISDQMLKFHENDSREHCLELFEAKRKEILDKI